MSAEKPGEPQMKQRWCDHIFQAKGSSDPSYLQCSASGAYDENTNSVLDWWKLCPICGTPRPVEKSLEQKFREYIFKWHPKATNGEICALVEIAEAHYTEKERG